MKGMEAAIRNALAKAGDPDERTRAHVYRSAREALTRSLEKRGITDPAVTDSQVSRLDDLIASIEAEYAPAEPVAGPAVRSPRVEPTRPATEKPAFPQAEHREPGFEERAEAGFLPRPELRAEGRFVPGFEPQAPAAPPVDSGNADTERRAPEIDLGDARPAGPDDGLTILPPTRRDAAPAAEPARRRRAEKRAARQAEKRERAEAPRKRRRSGLAGLFSLVVLLAFLGIGFWFLYEVGALQSIAERDTSVSNPPPRTASEDFEGAPLNPDSAFSGAWTTIFAADEGEPAGSGGAALTETVAIDSRSALRITSEESGAAGEVRLAVPASVLGQIAGRQAMIALTVRASGDEATQFYVRCDFGSLGDCGRRRFNAGYEITDRLFDIDFSDQPAPDGDGEIIINSDISGAGRGIDLLSLRIRPAD